MDASNFMDELMAASKGGTGRPVGRPKGPEKEKLPALHVREVPSNVKDALSALTEVGTLGFDENDLSMLSTYGSQGDVVKTLMFYGMTYIEPYMAKELERERKASEVYGVIVRRFLDDMSLPFVTESHFPEGSPAHAELLAIRNDVEADNGENAWLCGGLNRNDAFDHAAAIQWRFERLARALRAVGAVIAERRGKRQTQSSDRA